MRYLLGPFDRDLCTCPVGKFGNDPDNYVCGYCEERSELWDDDLPFCFEEWDEFKTEAEEAR